MESESTIEVLPPYESRSYVDLTVAAMQQFGVKVAARARKNGSVLYRMSSAPTVHRQRLCGGGQLQPGGAFLAVLGCVIGGITVTGLNPASQQGDKVILDILQRCGGKFKAMEGGYRFSQSLAGIGDRPGRLPRLRACTVHLGCFCSGETVIHNAGRLRLESDRIEAMQTELAKMGARIQVEGTRCVSHRCGAACA